jgi:transposase-like protein
MLAVDVTIAVVLIVTKMRCPQCKGSLAELWWAIRSGDGPSACPHCHVSFQELYKS